MFSITPDAGKDTLNQDTEDMFRSPDAGN